MLRLEAIIAANDQGQNGLLRNLRRSIHESHLGLKNPTPEKVRDVLYAVCLVGRK